MRSAGLFPLPLIYKEVQLSLPGIPLDLKAILFLPLNPLLIPPRSRGDGQLENFKIFLSSKKISRLAGPTILINLSPLPHSSLSGKENTNSNDLTSPLYIKKYNYPYLESLCSRKRYIALPHKLPLNTP